MVSRSPWSCVLTTRMPKAHSDCLWPLLSQYIDSTRQLVSSSGHCWWSQEPSCFPSQRRNLSVLLLGLEETWQNRSACCGHFVLSCTSPAPGQADLVTVVPGCGLEPRQRYLSGWLEPSAGRRAMALPAACLPLGFLSRVLGSCRDSEMGFFCLS